MAPSEQNCLDATQRNPNLLQCTFNINHIGYAACYLTTAIVNLSWLNFHRFAIFSPALVLNESIDHLCTKLSTESVDNRY